MKIKTLGIFDSGLGGFSVYHDLKSQGPDIEYILFADQKNAPYGNKSNEEIYQLASQGMQWFKNQGINHVLLACNTVSAVALDQLNQAFPDMSIWGIINLTLSQIQNMNESLAVVSTQATYQSHAYQKAWLGNNDLVEKALPELVAMIEDGQALDKIDAYLEKELKSLSSQESLILACTHFPLVQASFKKFFPGKIVDSRTPIRTLVEGIAQVNDQPSKIYTSGDPMVLQKQIKDLFSCDEKVRRVEA